MPSRYASSPAAPADAAAERPFHCPTCHRSIAVRGPDSGQRDRARPRLARQREHPGLGARVSACAGTARAGSRTALEALRRHSVSADAMPILPTPLRIGRPRALPGTGRHHRLPGLRLLRAPGPRRAAGPHRCGTSTSRTARRRREDLEQPGRLELARDDDVRGGLRERHAVDRLLPRRRLGGAPRAGEGAASMRRVTHDDIRRGLEWVVREPQALRHPHRQRELRRRLRGLLPAGRALAGGGAGHARRASSSARPWATRATRPAIPCCRRPRRRPRSPWAALDDQNRLAFAGYDMYHSSYGPDRRRPAEARGHRARHLGGRAHPARHAHRRAGRSSWPPWPVRTDAELQGA